MANCDRWPPVYIESWLQFHIYCYALCVNSTYVGRSKGLFIICAILYMCRNLHSLAELPYAQSTSVLFPQIWTTDWNFVVAADYCASSHYSLTGFSTRPPGYAFRTVHLHSNFHSGTWFPQVGHLHSWAVLNRTKCGQHGFHGT